MKLFLTAAVVLSLAAIAAPDRSQAQALAATRLYKVGEHGGTVEIDFAASLDPDCRSRGVTTVNLLTEPRGGDVQTRIERRFPAFSKANVRSRCDTRRVPATVIYYHARPDFVGNDIFDVELVFPAGDARKVRYGIAVR